VPCRLPHSTWLFLFFVVHAVSGENPGISFTHQGGFLDKPSSVSISQHPADSLLRYTLDGSEPDLTNGSIYSGPLAISNTVVLRAALFSETSRVSKVFTRTFIVLDSTIHQANVPSGYPTGSNAWNGYRADYAMSPAVVNDPAYRFRIGKALRALPTLSIAAGPDALFGSDHGIYLHSQDRGAQWERPCSIEFFLPDGTLRFSTDCGLRIQGNSNRIPEKTPKRSFRLLFRDKYGAGHLNYPVFPDSTISKFNTLILRAEFNNSWTHWNPVSQVRGQRIRDAWLKDSQRAMGDLSGHTRFIHLYLNGLYWGIYDLTERPDAAFAAAYFGGNRDDYDVLNELQAKDGDAKSFTAVREMTNLQNPAEYQKVQRMLDVPSFINYLLVNFYAGNHDWGEAKNWYAIGRRHGAQQFRFFCWDGEFILQDLSDDVVGGGNQPFHLLGELRANSDFMMRMADQIQKQFFGNGPLTPKAAEERWMKRARELDVAIIAESARWGGHRRTIPYTRDKDWLEEQQRLRTNWFPQRTGIVLDQLRNAGFFPPIAPPELVQTNLMLSIRAATNAIVYFTTNGLDPRLPVKGSSAPGAMIYTNSICLPKPARVKARARLGDTWSALAESTFEN